MPTWLAAGELRIGLGCMRLPEDTAAATIESALAAGVTVFDTARAYEGSETLLAHALRGRTARVVTKGGMSRPDGAWVPDGRAKAIRADCERSLEALDGLPIDLYLLHGPDPRTPWRTSVRALAKLVDDGLESRIGLCNVSRDQLEEAFEHAPIAAVQSALSVVDDRALRGGLLERCVELDLTFIAHSPLGGPRGIRKLRRHPALSDVAAAHAASDEETGLAWLLSLAPNVVAIPGARTPQAAASAARAAALTLSPEERSAIGARRRRTARSGRGEVVVVMGIPGAGKSRIAADYAARGYVRLNRDELGGSLRDVVEALDDELRSGTRKAVLDNTYLTRAARSDIVDVASARGLRARLVWLDTPLAQAQVNLVERLLERFGRLPSPEELVQTGRSVPGLLSPTRQMRAIRELEEPGEDEGFADIERVPFERAQGSGRKGSFVAASAVDLLPAGDLDAAAPHLVFEWRPGGDPADLEGLAAQLPVGLVETAVCPHPGGPPTCWCRPPLPGLHLEFARRHGVDPACSVLVGTSTAHRTLATALGATFLQQS